MLKINSLVLNDLIDSIFSIFLPLLYFFVFLGGGKSIEVEKIDSSRHE